MAGSLTRAVAELKRLPRRLVEAGAERFEQIATTNAGRAGRGRAKRHDRGGVRLSEPLHTDETITVTTIGAVAEVVGTPAGPWVWLEYGTKPHPIGAIGQLLGERLDHPVYGPVIHPGIIGRRVWSESVRQFDAEVDATIDAEIRRIA